MDDARPGPHPDTRAREPARRPFSVLLRLLPEHGTEGRLVGHAEVVATSEVVAIGADTDLIDLVRRLSAGLGPPAG